MFLTSLPRKKLRNIGFGIEKRAPIVLNRGTTRSGILRKTGPIYLRHVFLPVAFDFERPPINPVWVSSSTSQPRPATKSSKAEEPQELPNILCLSSWPSAT